MTGNSQTPPARRNVRSYDGQRRRPLGIALSEDEEQRVRSRAAAAETSVSRHMVEAVFGAPVDSPVAPEMAPLLRGILYSQFDKLLPVAARLNDTAREANMNKHMPEDALTVVAEAVRWSETVRQTLQDFPRPAPSDTPRPDSAGRVGGRSTGPHAKRKQGYRVMLNDTESALLSAKARNLGWSKARVVRESLHAPNDGQLSRTEAWRLCREVAAVAAQLFGCVTNIRQLEAWVTPGSSLDSELRKAEQAVFSTAYTLRELRNELAR